MEIIKGITEESINKIIEWSYQFFCEHMDFISFTYHIQQTTDWDLSVILMSNNKTLGVYLLGVNQLPQYKDLRGVEGILLAVDNSIRGEGWGNKLKDYPKSLEIDYIWGLQLKSLNNLDDWLKRRELIGETEDCYVTIELFSK